MNRAKWVAGKLPNSFTNTMRKFVGRTPRLIPRYKLGRFAFTQHLRAIVRERDIDCIIDVGGNVGKFGRFLRNEIGFRGEIISFEPVRTNFEQLEAVAAGDKKWKVFQTALGRQPGRLSINVMKSDDFSSFL